MNKIEVEIMKEDAKKMEESRSKMSWCWSILGTRVGMTSEAGADLAGRKLPRLP